MGKQSYLVILVAFRGVLEERHNHTKLSIEYRLRFRQASETQLLISFDISWLYHQINVHSVMFSNLRRTHGYVRAEPLQIVMSWIAFTKKLGAQVSKELSDSSCWVPSSVEHFVLHPDLSNSSCSNKEAWKFPDSLPPHSKLRWHALVMDADLGPVHWCFLRNLHIADWKKLLVASCTWASTIRHMKWHGCFWLSWFARNYFAPQISSRPGVTLRIVSTTVLVIEWILWYLCYKGIFVYLFDCPGIANESHCQQKGQVQSDSFGF